MPRRKPGEERGDGILEFIGMLALTAAVIGTATYVLFFRDDGGRTFTPQEQAYIAAVATQQADAYIRAVETQRARETLVQQVSAPQQPAAPAPPPQSVVEQPTQPAIAPPAPTSPPSLPPSKPPMAACVGYMAGFTAGGIDSCNQITQDSSYYTSIRSCVHAIITGAGTSADGSGACVQAALHTSSNPSLSDCFLGLSGQSHFGMQSCRKYYLAN